MKLKISITKRFVSLLLAVAMLSSMFVIVPQAASEPLQTTGNYQVLNLFNSGKTSDSPSYAQTGGWYNKKTYNPDSSSFNNGGYDIWVAHDDNNQDRLGLSFVVNSEILDNPLLTVYAYDVDEDTKENPSDCERNIISLYDETTGTSVDIDLTNSNQGYLSGTNDTWSTTTYKIDPSVFTVGHTYHFESRETTDPANTNWTAYIRTVSLTLTTYVEPEDKDEDEREEEPEVTTPELTLAEVASANISSSGKVTTVINLQSNMEMAVSAECVATIDSNNKGTGKASATVTPDGTSITVTMNLDSDAPKGTYIITVTLKDGDGNVIKNLTQNAGYSYYAVSYNSNGGMNIVPHDDTAYSAGDNVTVMFDTIPTWTDYEFLGWATDSSATTPEFTADGANSFTIKGDTTLYAVWRYIHNYVIHEGKTPTCDEHGWKEYRTCDHCGYTNYSYLAPLGHSYTSQVTKEATCTEDGVITFTCSTCGDSYTVTTSTEHSYTKTVVPATCTQDGEVVYSCTKCGDTHKETITASHNYVAKVTAVATTTTEGEITYTCTVCGDSYTEKVPVRDKAEVLLIQDRLPWNGNNAATLLNRLVNNGYISGWDLVSSTDFASTDLSAYNVIYIANDQSTETYDKLATLNSALSDFATAGGVVVYGACDNGWADGNITSALPEGLEKISRYSKRNYILDEDHPVVTGSLTDNKALTNLLLHGDYCSHASFDSTTLPEGSNVILQDGNGAPTLVEYPVGDGHIIVSGLTWEYYYTKAYFYSTTFSKNVFDDLIVYAIDLSDDSTCNHRYNAGEVVEPTCEAQGYTLHTCSRCGDTQKDTFVPATDHKYGEWVVVKEANCFENGLKTSTCEYCGTAVEAVIEKSNHSYSSTSKAPTCTEGGYTVYTCDICGDSYESDKTEPAGHSFSEWITDSEAGCTEEGVTHRECANCGEIEEGTTPALGHIYTSTVTAPTCTEEGYTTHICSRCDDTYTDSVTDALGHKYSVVVTAPTCTTDGYTTYTCDVCGDTYVADETKATGHSFGEWITDVEATCTEEGVTHRECSNCDATENGTIPALGHIYTSTVTKPTCTEEGYTTHICSRCDDTYTDSITEALGHNYTESVTESTCTTGGYTTYTCDACKDSYIANETGAKGHSFGEWITDVEANCTEDGKIHRECINCDEVEYDTVPAIGHNYSTTVTNPTCTEKGYTTYICIVCSDTYEDDYVDELGHDYESTVTSPTCLDGGYTTHICTRCDDTYIDSETEATGHSFSEWITDVEAGCTEEGITHRECANCDATENGTIPALGHIYTSTVTAPTCTEEGYTTHICSRCDDTYTDSVTEALGHKYSSVVTAPTCTTDGYTTYTCDVCGDTYVADETQATGHEFSEWLPDIEATCLTEGREYRECTICYIQETITIPALGHNYSSEVTEATCTENGYTTHICSRCNDTYTDNETEAFGHSYSTVVTEPTCTTDGYTTYTCDACGDTYVADDTQATGHSFGEWITDVEASCTGSGTTYRECMNCDEIEYDTLSATGHSLTSTVTAPTCTEKGYTTYTCTACSFEYKDEYIDELGHDYESTVTSPTCLDGGYTTHICTRCDDTYIDSETEATGHSFSEWITDVEATCTEEGITHRECANCGATEKGTTPTLGHIYTATVTAPTCTEEGYTTHICSRCDDTYTDSVTDALGHKYSAVVTAPTCTTDGYTTYTCDVCGDTYVSDETKATGHSFGEWITDTDANCTEEGATHRECSNCEAIEDGTIPALGHIYTSTVTKPTCTEEGYTTHICSRCDDTYTDSITEALGHKYSSEVTAPTCTEKGYTTHICSRCDDTYTDSVTDALGHKYSAVVTAPTCTTDGYTTYTCDVCGDTYVSDETKATGHNFGNWITDTDATCTEEGTAHRDCADCEATEKGTTPAAGHTDGEWVVVTKPTETTKGEKTVTCTVCGEVTKREDIPETSDAVFIFHDAEGHPGDTIKVKLSMNGNEVLNSVGLTAITYDSSVLEFVGFADTDSIDEYTVIPAWFDENRMTITFALSQAQKFTSDICTLEFRIKDDANTSETIVTATPLVKFNSDVLYSTVRPATVKVTVLATGVSLGINSIELGIGKTHKLYATVLPENATNKSVVWESSDESIVTVSDGLVTAIKDGNATITVTTADGGYTASCEVKVCTPVDGVTLNKTTLELIVTQSETLIATVTPENATNKDVIWKSSDENIVTVVDGKVTALAAGSATVTVTTVDGLYTATCQVMPRMQLLGDINDNGSVDLKDAVLLFNYSMLPDVFPIPYLRNTDFTKDGNLDIDDAILLFQYSMLPDLYPIE